MKKRTKIKVRRLLALTLTVVLMVALLAACGNENTPASGAASGGETPADGGTSVGERSKTFNVASGDAMYNVDPHQVTTPGDELVLKMCYDNLIETDHSNNLSANLAESWEYNETATELTFKLREGVTFQNGEPFNADVFVYNCERIIAQRDTMAIMMLYFYPLVDAVKIDEYTAKMIFNEPFPSAVNFMYTFLMIPMQAHQEMGDSMFIDMKHIGTGPWVFDEWSSGQYAHVTKNPNYWNIDEYDSYFEDGYIRFILEPSSAIAAHITGDVDAFVAMGGIAPDALSLYEGSDSKIDLITVDSSQYADLRYGFPSEDAPLYDAKLREAIDIAIDRQALSDGIFRGAGIPTGVMLPGWIGYDPDMEPYEYNPERAKQLVAESTYDGQPLVFMGCDAFLKSEDVVMAITAMLEEIGLTIEPMIEDLANFNAIHILNQWDLMYCINQSINGDPWLFVNSRFVTDYMKAGFKGPDAERLIDIVNQFNFEPDPVKRNEYAMEINRFNKEFHGPAFALSFFKATYAVTKGITGVTIGTDGYDQFIHIDWDPSLAA